MRLCRCQIDGEPQLALFEGGELDLLSEPPFSRIVRSGRRVPLEAAKLLAPVEPSKIVCVGLNYRAHAAELRMPLPERPLLFLKPPSALLAPEADILLPPESAEVHYEAELAVVIGRRCRRVSPEQARACVLGFTCINDVTARDIQREEVQFTRAKGFDTFAPLGPWIETDVDPSSLAVVARVNGSVRQAGSTSDMVFGAFELVSFVSRGMTLLPGDVLATGTPPGVGPLVAGDEVEIEVEGIGVLRNRVRTEERSSTGE
ncbi:MAG: fumarylacetoacetate hydrolase family protein [Myxococcales bacterium]|jgi:2-keto-4-pentenoate hydratase/2-oxohepta-3-ene-1,7-dioic acid hydratase in catechol pathway